MNLENMTENLERAFPELRPLGTVQLIGEGFGSYALETGAGVVFRVARVVEAGQAYAREWQVLPLLQDDLPVAIPAPRWRIESSTAFPFGVIGYPKLAGQPVDTDRLDADQARSLADQVGALIAAFQRVPIRLLPLLDNFDERWAGWARLRDQALPALRDVFRPGELGLVEAWWEEFLADPLMRAYTPVLQHGDLWFGNLLMEDHRLVGLLDFQEVGLGDPALDFVPQLYLGQRFLEWALAAFEKAGGAAGPHFMHRLRHLWAVREFGGLVYAIQQADRAEFAEAVEKIRKGPILSPAGLDGWQRFGSG